MQEETKPETQVVEEETVEFGSENKIRRIFRTELIVIACIGVLVGFLVKTEAAKRITIGFEDYKVSRQKQAYDVTKLEQELKKKAEEAAKAQQQAAGAPAAPEAVQQQPAEQKPAEQPAGADCAGDTCTIPE